MKWFKKTKKLRREITESLMPDRRFAEGAKRRFLSSYDAHQSFRREGVGFLEKRREAWGTVWKVVGAGAAAFGIVAATSVYADVRNVAPTNMLYPLKRLAENVSLAVAPASVKPALELSFAARRAQEINALTASPDAAAYAPLVANLTSNMDSEVSSSIVAAAHVHLKGEALSSFCSIVSPAPMSVSSTMESSSDHGGRGYGDEISIGERLRVNQTLSAAASADCAAVTGAEAASADSASSSVPSNASVSIPADFHDKIQIRIKEDHYVHGDTSENMLSTATSTAIGTEAPVFVDTYASGTMTSSTENPAPSLPSASVYGNDNGGRSGADGSDGDGGNGNGNANARNGGGGTGVTVTLPIATSSIGL